MRIRLLALLLLPTPAWAISDDNLVLIAWVIVVGGFFFALWLGFKILAWLWRALRGTGSSAKPNAHFDTKVLKKIKISYHAFSIVKRNGTQRQIFAPNPELKQAQRQLLGQVLANLPVHEAVTGFEPGLSIADNARMHEGKAVVVRMDIQDFFPSTSAGRVEQYFLHLGWSKQNAALMTRLCTWQGALPQGAPTSPCLSNVLNYKLDKRLAGLANKFNATYTRYADDLTFSFREDKPAQIGAVIRMTERILKSEGYKLHTRSKLHVRRAHQQQLVTGLVVNQKTNLPRTTRRRLRAIEHQLKTKGTASLTAAQLAGWKALQQMVEG